MFTKIKLVSPVYRVGWCKSGSSPELECTSFSKMSIAKKFLAQKLKSIAVVDCASSDSLQIFLCKGSQQYNVQVGEYVYSITKQ